MKGKIKNIGPIFGFIASIDDNQDYYFRTLSIDEGSVGKLSKDDIVEFDHMQNERGRPEAIKIRFIEKGIPQTTSKSPGGETICELAEKQSLPQVRSQRISVALHGKVDRFDNGEGFITCTDGVKYGVSWRNITQDGFRVLYPTEEVLFDELPNSRVKVAINVRPAPIPLLRGTIVAFDEEEGFLETDGTREKLKFLAVHISHSQYWEYEVGDRVKFRPVVIKQEPCAVRVSWIDKRKPLERFANLSKLWALLNKLAGMTDENWDFRINPTGELPILENYVYYTFKRIEQQNKITMVQHSKSGKWMASFNTGLATPQQQEIFAFFKEVEDYDPSKHRDPDLAPPRWRLESFVTESDTAMLDFHPLPRLATYFEWDDLGSLIYDPNFELRIRRKHILNDRKDRILSIGGLPDYIKENEEALVSQFNVAVELAKKRVMRNYKTAIPTFSRGELSLLLPVCMVKKDGADLALLVQRRNNYYMAWTILPLDIAYMNARLIARPDTEWLNP
jgi:cold shock CspA family protein